MFTKRELTKIRKALPKNGCTLISNKLGGISADNVRMVLTEPRRYRADVLDAAKEVIEDFKTKVAAQKKEIMEVVK